jgi:hypothetical protein
MHSKFRMVASAPCTQGANCPRIICTLRAQVFRPSSADDHNSSLPSGAEALKERFMDRTAAGVRKISRPKKRLETGSDGFEYFQHDPPWVKLTAWLLLNLRFAFAVTLRALTVVTLGTATVGIRATSLRDMLGVMRHLLG